MYQSVKRVIDFIGAVVLLILAGIPMIIVAICIKLEDGGPVFFKQQRIGKNLKPFYIYKFRSMRVDRKELQSNLTHDQMVTKVGKIIRATSLDELPQLFNILKGEMAFIGPRPWIREYYSWFTKEQKRRSDVLPGISGLAQVKGRNGIEARDHRGRHDLHLREGRFRAMGSRVERKPLSPGAVEAKRERDHGYGVFKPSCQSLQGLLWRF